MSYKRHLIRFARDQRGLAAVEYAFLCGLIVLAMIAAFSSLANAVISTWTHISSQSTKASQQAPLP